MTYGPVNPRRPPDTMSGVTDVWTGFQTMTAEECRRLLASTHIGRVAITSGALPMVLPVHYEVDDDRLVLRTPGHHELGDGIDGQVVGFEADHLDIDHGVGWCVSVTGTAELIAARPSIDPVHRWFSDGALLALGTEVIAGHRVVV